MEKQSVRALLGSFFVIVTAINQVSRLNYCDNR
jgi:hypothetical protein